MSGYTHNLFLSALRFVEKGLGAVFTDRFNPFYYLGSLAFYFFWIVAVSGIYLFIYFETSIAGAYQSVEVLTVEQWYFGGVMRSLHRYASDAMLLMMGLHLYKEWVTGRFRGARWFSWVSGVPLVWLLFAAGIGGYWLVWDELAQYIAVLTAEWLDWLPIFSESMARNFLNNSWVSDRFFSLLVFLHIGIPLALLLGMWIHIQRISQPMTNPPKRLALGTLGTLLVLSVIHPAVSQPPANLDQSVTLINFDWFYLHLYPLLDLGSPEAMWLVTGLITFGLFLLPLLPNKKRNPAAVVDLEHCNGCGWCVADCPYAAIRLRDRTDSLPHEEEAWVNSKLCVGCGICVGACSTATPFRKVGIVQPGVDLPGEWLEKLREEIYEKARASSDKSRIAVFGCQHSAQEKLPGNDALMVLTLPCIAALPPSFIDFIFSRNIADGVLLTGCRESDCFHRRGVQWTEERIAAQREPRLRDRVIRERIRLCWCGDSIGELKDAVTAFADELAQQTSEEAGTE